MRSVAVITEDDLDANVLGLLPGDSKNKAKKVQDVIHDIKKSNIKDGKSPVFPVEKVVSAEDNNAKEEYGYGDEKMYDEGEVEKGNIPVENNEIIGKDSNEASENIVEEKVVLPPSDGSLTFHGPKNDRQKEVVDAFLHAWKGTIYILRKHLYSTKLNLTSKFFIKLGFFIKTKKFLFQRYILTKFSCRSFYYINKKKNA